MGLEMKDKKKICEEIHRRYQMATKKDRGKLLDEYAVTLGYNRDYLANILSHWGKTVYDTVSGRPVVIKACPPRVRNRSATTTQAVTSGRRGRKPKYRETFKVVLTDIWELFDCLCGKLLAPMIRLMIDFLVVEFSLEKDMRDLLLSLRVPSIASSSRSRTKGD